MKKNIILLFLFPIFFAFQCEPGEPCSATVIQKSKSNLISIENLQSSYNIGDTIWLNSTLDRNQIFDNSSEPIDLYSYPLEFEYGIQFYKFSIYNPEIFLCLDENTTEFTIGHLNSCNMFVYEKTNNSLKSRVGIKLLESGSYKIALSTISTFRNSGLTCEDRGLDIYTSFSNNNQDIISFTVQ